MPNSVAIIYAVGMLVSALLIATGIYLELYKRHLKKKLAQAKRLKECPERMLLIRQSSWKMKLFSIYNGIRCMIRYPVFVVHASDAFDGSGDDYEYVTHDLTDEGVAAMNDLYHEAMKEGDVLGMEHNVKIANDILRERKTK